MVYSDPLIPLSRAIQVQGHFLHLAVPLLQDMGHVCRFSFEYMSRTNICPLLGCEKKNPHIIFRSNGGCTSSDYSNGIGQQAAKGEATPLPGWEAVALPYNHYSGPLIGPPAVLCIIFSLVMSGYCHVS
jgi:hypothetical protein